MWTCIKCGQTIDDEYTVCPYCGASRSAGRFGGSQSARNAAAYTAQPRQNARPSGQPAARAETVLTPRQAPQAQYVPDFSHVKAGRGFMLLGTLLALLLPALVILLAVLRHSALSGCLWALLADSPETQAPSFWVRYPLYGLLALISALLAALPGLWTLGLGKMLRRLNRMEELL